MFKEKTESASQVELLRYLEAAVKEKQLIFEEKGEFMRQLSEAKQTLDRKLFGIFERLNELEDQYYFEEKQILEIKTKIRKNREEIATLEAKTKMQAREREELGSITASLAESKRQSEELSRELAAEIKEMEEKVEQTRADITESKVREQKIQAQYFAQKIEYLKFQQINSQLSSCLEEIKRRGGALEKASKEGKDLVQLKREVVQKWLKEESEWQLDTNVFEIVLSQKQTEDLEKMEKGVKQRNTLHSQSEVFKITEIIREFEEQRDIRFNTILNQESLSN